MDQPIAYLNGRHLPQDQLFVPPQDLGFLWGATVAEQLRTFRGELFLLEQHLQRLERGLQVMRIAVSLEAIAQAAGEVARHNYALLDPANDLGLTIFVTPGMSPTYQPHTKASPTVGIHSYPLPFSLWADKYQNGQHCAVSAVAQVSAACWPRDIKVRSRLHYYLADQEVRSRNPQARAVLLDEAGHINEASTANVVVLFPGEGLVSPPGEGILPGVSLQFVESLAREHNEAFAYRPIAATELDHAEEVFLTSTPFCLLPVSRWGERSLPQREMCNQLLRRWSDRVGVDIVAQAQRAVTKT